MTLVQYAAITDMSAEDLDTLMHAIDRAGDRKKLEFQHMREQVALLEKKLEELKRVVTAEPPGAATSTFTSALTLAAPPSSQSSQPRRTDLDIRELLHLIKTYQHEQLCLHNAIQRQEKVAAALSLAVNESKRLVFGSTSIYSGVHQPDEDFLWVNTVLPFLPAFSKAHVTELVRESYLEIVRHVEAAASLAPEADLVFGWRAKRLVTDHWTDFGFDKTFPSEDVDVLAAKSWEAAKHQTAHEVLKEGRVKVLETLNDDAFIVARSVDCVMEDRSFSSISVVLRVQTPDGYVIGSRTIQPLPQHGWRLQQALGPRRTYTHQFYSLSLSRSKGSAGGCCVHRSGRVSSGNANHAQTVGTIVMLATLRWQIACVKPLPYLTGDSDDSEGPSGDETPDVVDAIVAEHMRRATALQRIAAA
ncbi:hypothetical protein PybrP1_003590 [[Pythium] brassicae (nom. inval.)]|nr:hypothetical protein PybrP1_003590 [[Pythium] brassicae (nom. inval.)]